MAESVIVTFERKSYTFDGRFWYGTEDYLKPPFGMIHKLNALIPAPEPEVKPAKPARVRR